MQRSGILCTKKELELALTARKVSKINAKINQCHYITEIQLKDVQIQKKTTNYQCLELDS